MEWMFSRICNRYAKKKRSQRIIGLPFTVHPSALPHGGSSKALIPYLRESSDAEDFEI
jgi:hypothetical protein